MFGVLSFLLPDKNGFIRGNIYPVVKSRVESLASPAVTELDRLRVRSKKYFFRSYFVTLGLTLTRDLVTEDYLLLKSRWSFSAAFNILLVRHE